MNKLVYAFAALCLLGCSTPQPPAETERQPLPVAQTVPIPPPEIQRDLPLEQREMLAGRVCKLGTSCMELDPRPFEVCLVGTKHCVDKALEPVEVHGPKAPDADSKPLTVSQKKP